MLTNNSLRKSGKLIFTVVLERYFTKCVFTVVLGQKKYLIKVLEADLHCCPATTKYFTKYVFLNVFGQLAIFHKDTFKLSWHNKIINKIYASPSPFSCQQKHSQKLGKLNIPPQIYELLTLLFDITNANDTFIALNSKLPIHHLDSSKFSSFSEGCI